MLLTQQTVKQRLCVSAEGVRTVKPRNNRKCTRISESFTVLQFGFDIGVPTHLMAS